jgi:hypothetical protein
MQSYNLAKYNPSNKIMFLVNLYKIIKIVSLLNKKQVLEKQNNVIC